MKKPVVIFGAGENFKRQARRLFDTYEIKALVDNDPDKQGSVVNGLSICSVDILHSIKFDNVIITPQKFDDIAIQLYELGIPEEKLRLPFLNISLHIIKKKCTFINNGIIMNISTVSDAFVCEEVFISEIYNGYYGDNVTLIDIGMNIGAASLFFANKKWVRRIYAFEPFPVFEQAMENIELNPRLKSKISAFNYGIAGGDMIDVKYASYDPHVSHRSSIYDQSYDGVSIKLTNIMDALDKIIIEANRRNSPIVLKLDAEGCEYDIIYDLYKSGWLIQISAILLEIHLGKHPDGFCEIETLLIQSGYKYVCNQGYRFMTNLMMYAFK